MFETVLAARAGQGGEDGRFVARVERGCAVMYCADRCRTVSADLACTFEGSAIAASSTTPKHNEDEATGFGGSCSERVEGFEIRASTVVFVRESAGRLCGVYRG